MEGPKEESIINSVCIPKTQVVPLVPLQCNTMQCNAPPPPPPPPKPPKVAEAILLCSSLSVELNTGMRLPIQSGCSMHAERGLVLHRSMQM